MHWLLVRNGCAEFVSDCTNDPFGPPEKVWSCENVILELGCLVRRPLTANSATNSDRVVFSDREEDLAKAAFIVIRVSDATRGKMGMLDYF